MFTPFLDGYGYGWEIKKVDGRLMAQHGGGIEGFVSQFVRFLDEDLSLIILSNFDFAPLSQFTHDLISLISGKPIVWPKERKVINLPPEIFDRYCGEYEISPGSSIRIFRQGQRFWVQVEGQRQVEILPESETRFFGRLLEVEINFSLDAEGRANALTLIQGRKEIQARKIR